MSSWPATRLVWGTLVVIAGGGTASTANAGQQGISPPDKLALNANLRFYGDDTEFSNPFREGETLFGAVGRFFGTFRVSDRVDLSVGLIANHRFGSDEAFELVRPIAALTIRTPRSSFVFGTLPEPRRWYGAGPDRAGPHGLLPPIQRDSLYYERPYEAGLLWTVDQPRLRHEVWLNWQRLNTPGHRERFDAGVNGRVPVSRLVGVGFQTHVVHQGGQRFNVGPVGDSAAAATGVVLERRLGALDTASLELWGVVSHYEPDRRRSGRNGAGLFVRAAGERRGWRGHAIVWRGCCVVKDEGDSNYFSMRMDGTRYRGVRDYSEAGLTRTFLVAPEVRLEASFRLHRIERDYEYSFRIVAIADMRWVVR